MLALALSMLAPIHAEVKYDALRPQEIIVVPEGQTVHNSDAGFTVDLTQANVGQSNTNRTAIAKDGQGTLVIDRAVDMYCPIVVREGTLLIKDTDVTDHPYLESPVLTVGGINAQMVLDNATFTQTTEYGRGYVAAVSVGGRDGDGTLTLQNGAVLTHAQSFFLGGVSYVAPLDGNDTGAHICGSYLSTEGDTLFRDKAGENGGFINPHVGTRGRLSTGTLNVLSGSTYNTGIGFYGGNGTINIDGEGSVINSGVRAADADNTMLGWTQSTYAKCVLNITNGGVYNAGVNAAQNFYTSQYSDTTAEINISGQGSALNISGNAAISNGRSYTNCHTAIRVDDHGSIHVAKHLQMSYGGQYSTMQLTNGGDVTVDGQFIIGTNGWVETDAASTIHANATFLFEGAALVNHGTIVRNAGVDGAPETGYVALARGSRFQTGTALLSGREDPNVPGDAMEVDYGTGLDGVNVLYYDSGNGAVTIGALLEGKDVMQFLKRSDMETINAKVNEALGLGAPEMYELAYEHEIGRLVQVEYTTDELNHVNGEERLVVAGGGVVVENGEQMDPETKVGTIGSYLNLASETQAHLAVSETAEGSKIWWKGTGLETVAGETAVFNKGFSLDINAGTGTLTVVTDSQLDNESEIKAIITVQDGAVLNNRGVLISETEVEQGGTLKGAGTIAATTVRGNLVVGNSPGLVTAKGNLTLAPASNTTFSLAGLENPATAVMGGWDSGTYSRISLQVGASLVLQAGAKFTIEFGGEDLLGSCLPGGQDTPITLNLLLAEGSVTLPQGYVGEMTEYGLDVTGLIDSVFRVTTDAAAGLGIADNMYVNFNEGDYHYYVNQDEGGTYNLTLRGSGVIGRVPEPATGTLGILALAALCMRRRRK